MEILAFLKKRRAPLVRIQFCISLLYRWKEFQFRFILWCLACEPLAGSSNSDEMQDNDTLKGGDSISTWKVIAPGFTHSNFKMKNTFRIANAKNASNPTWVVPYHFREAGRIKIWAKSIIYCIRIQCLFSILYSALTLFLLPSTLKVSIILNFVLSLLIPHTCSSRPYIAYFWVY